MECIIANGGDTFAVTTPRKTRLGRTNLPNMRSVRWGSRPNENVPRFRTFTFLFYSFFIFFSRELHGPVSFIHRMRDASAELALASDFSLEQPVVPVASHPARRSAFEAVLDIVFLGSFVFLGFSFRSFFLASLHIVSAVGFIYIGTYVVMKA